MSKGNFDFSVHDSLKKTTGRVNDELILICM